MKRTALGILGPLVVIPTAAWAVPMSASAPAAPSSAAVSVGPGGSATYDPPEVKVRVGGTVTWTWSSSGHSVTDSSGLDLFDSGVLGSGSTFSFTVFASGKYRYVSTADSGMSGTVSVPIRINPSTGTDQTMFKLTWADAAPPQGVAYDVESRVKGAPRWGRLNFSAKRAASLQLPRGKWQFRERMELVAPDGAHTDWSPIGTLTVTP